MNKRQWKKWNKKVAEGKLVLKYSQTMGKVFDVGLETWAEYFYEHSPIKTDQNRSKPIKTDLI